MAQNMTIDEVIASHIEATNLDKERDVNAMRMEFTMSMQGLELPGEIYRSRPNKQYVKSEFQGRQFVQAYDGEMGWSINPMIGGAPTKMTEQEAEQMSSEPFENDFLDYKEKGHTLELVGEAEVDGVATYEVKMTKKNGDVVFSYLDQETFVTIMQKREVKSGPQAGTMVETYLSDYDYINPDDEGSMVMPFSLETRVNGQTGQILTITKVELDPEFEATIFDFPEATETEDE